MVSNKYIFLVFFFGFIFCEAQNSELNTKKIDSLLTLKKEMINNNDIKSFYTIQLFSGKKNGAEEVKKNFDTKAYEYKATIKYETPNYKVWVGMFRTKLYADKAYEEVKKDFPNALVLKPGR
jgi:hypothetical protein